MLKITRVGVGFIIYDRKRNKILMHKRKGTGHADGFYSVGGGHLEFKESFEEAVRREIKEESSLKVGIVEQIGITNDYFKETDKHYITIFMLAEYIGGSPINMEPDKSEGWFWIDPDKIVTPLFPTVESLLKLNIKIAPGVYLKRL